MPRNLLRPNLKAVQAIMAAARQLGDDCNWDKLVEMTGYDIRLVKQVLMNRPRLRPKPVDPPAPVPEVPQWVKEVTKVTGLELVFHRKINKLTQQWILISPNGVPLLWLSGSNEDVLREVRTMRPSTIPMLQGISTEQHRRRRRRNGKKQENGE
jgi:hypothetical protein